jgi:hypothetical protein
MRGGEATVIRETERVSDEPETVMTAITYTSKAVVCTHMPGKVTTSDLPSSPSSQRDRGLSMNIRGSSLCGNHKDGGLWITRTAVGLNSILYLPFPFSIVICQRRRKKGVIQFEF